MSDETAKVIDLNELAPEPRLMKLGDVVFDAGRIPLRLVAKGAALQDLAERGGFQEQLDAILDWLLEVIRWSAPEVTRDWLLDSITSQAQMTEMLNAIMSSAFGTQEAVELGEVTPEAVGGTDE